MTQTLKEVSDSMISEINQQLDDAQVDDNTRVVVFVLMQHALNKEVDRLIDEGANP